MRTKSQDQDASDYLTPMEASRATGLSVRQLSRLADEGRLNAIRPGAHRRYLAASVEGLLAQDADWSPAP